MEMLIQAIAVYRKKNGDGQDSIYRRACEQCVNAGGLKSIFPVLIGKALPRAHGTFGQRLYQRGWN
jgi:hypothetical protein